MFSRFYKASTMLLKKLKRTKPIAAFLTIFIFISAFSSISAYGAECGIMLFLKNKSRGVNVSENSCKSADEIALGTVFELTSGGRLWLKSQSAPDTDSDFQVICQSRSLSPVQVSVSNIFLPWINPKGLKNCTSWVDHHMSCDDVSGNKNSFFCAIALIKRPEYNSPKEIERTTSIKLRKLENNVSIDQLTKAMDQEAGLCRNLYQSGQQVDVAWTINKSGSAKNIQLKSFKNPVDKEFIDCVMDVVKDFSYPAYSNEVSVSHKF